MDTNTTNPRDLEETIQDATMAYEVSNLLPEGGDTDHCLLRIIMQNMIMYI